MNGLIDNQTSGNKWSPQIPAMLHERAQEAPIYRPLVQRSTLQEFEAQMEQYEEEYADQLSEIRRLYVFSEDESVADFLNDHRALPQILISAMPQLRKIFGDSIFALRATSDEDGWQNLYVDVLWPGDATDVFRLLDQFGDDWWIANSRSARGYLTFTYRLV